LAREQRKLAAIVAADVVGYSRLMGRDESGTLARLRKTRSEHLDPVLTKYGGRLVKLTGDGALIEFASAVDALSAAIEFQQAMAEANHDQPADTALVFRMDLHLGHLSRRRQSLRRWRQRCSNKRRALPTLRTDRGMNRADLQRRMQRAEDMVRRLKENIAFQRETIVPLDGGGHNVKAANMFCGGWRPRMQSTLLSGIDCSRS
jgi:hypothetical protein